MPSYVDALASRLAELQQSSSLPWGKFSRGMRERLQGLLDTGVLKVEKSGRGQRVVVELPNQLETFILHLYPHGLLAGEAVGRAAAIRAARSAKHRHQRSQFSTILVRVLREGVLTTPELAEGGLHRLTTKLGAAVFVLGREPEPRCCGVVVTVENEDVFHRIEELIPTVDVAIYTAGRMSSRMIEWLERQSEIQQLIHAGDYDPVGVAEYLRLQTALGGRVSLYIPADLEELFQRYSDPALLQRVGNQRALARVQESQDASVRRIVALIQRHGAGLEQEILLDA